jgi:microcystin-dependent protein
VLGQRAGEENHTLTLNELGAHPHGAVASSNAADQTTPGGNYWANGGQTSYTRTPGTSMALSSIVGGGQPHPNVAPYLTLNVVIALFGVFPSRN